MPTSEGFWSRRTAKRASIRHGQVLHETGSRFQHSSDHFNSRFLLPVFFYSYPDFTISPFRLAFAKLQVLSAGRFPQITLFDQGMPVTDSMRRGTSSVDNSVETTKAPFQFPPKNFSHFPPILATQKAVQSYPTCPRAESWTFKSALVAGSTRLSLSPQLRPDTKSSKPRSTWGCLSWKLPREGKA